MPVNYGGILGGYINTDEALVSMAGQRLANQQGVFNLAQAQENAAIQARSRAALMDAAARQQSMATAGMSNAPITPEAMANAEQGASAPALSTGSPGQKGPKLSELHLKEYKSDLEKARAVAATGNIALHEALSKSAEAALAKATTAAAEERKEQKANWDRVINLVSAPYDEASLNDVVALAAKDYPELPQMMDQWGFTRNPATQRLEWDDNAKKKIEAIKEAALTQAQRTTLAEKEAERARKEKEAEREAEDRKERLRLQAIRDAETRENRQWTREQKEALRLQREREQRERSTERVQRSLERDPVYGNFTKYEFALDQALAFKEKIKDPRNFEKEIDASQVSSLVAAFNGIKENFRPQAGGKYQLQEVERFNGLVDKVQLFYKTLGRGSGPLNEARANDLANTIEELYDIANKNAVLVSLQGIETASKRLADPDAIKIKGNMARLKQKGQLWETMVGNKRYLNIGNKNNFKSFEVLTED